MHACMCPAWCTGPWSARYAADHFPCITHACRRTISRCTACKCVSAQGLQIARPTVKLLQHEALDTQVEHGPARGSQGTNAHCTAWWQHQRWAPVGLNFTIVKEPNTAGIARTQDRTRCAAACTTSGSGSPCTTTVGVGCELAHCYCIDPSTSLDCTMSCAAHLSGSSP